MTFLIPHELIQCERFAGGPFDIANSEDEQIGPHHAAIEPVRATTTLDAAEYADIWPVDFSHNLADEEFRQAKSVRNSDFGFMPSHFAFPPAVNSTDGQSRSKQHTTTSYVLEST